MFRTDRIVEVKAAGTSFWPRRAMLLRTYLAHLRTDSVAP